VSSLSAVRTRIANVRPFSAVVMLIALVLAGLVVYPLVRVLTRLFVSDGSIDVSPVGDALNEPDLWVIVRNTLILTVTSALIAVVVGSLLAWLSQRTDASLGPVTDAMPLLTIVLPAIASSIGWMFLASEKSGYLNAFIRWLLGMIGIDMQEGPLNIHSWPGMIFIYTIYQIPFAFLMVSAGFRNSDASLEEQSRVCGAGLGRTLRLVTIPSVRAHIGAALLFMVWFGFSFFSGPIIIGPRAEIEVLSMRIVRLLTFTYPAETARAVGLSMIMVLAVGTAWYLQGRVLRGGRQLTVSGRGARHSVIELGKWKWPARLLLVFHATIVFVLPIIGLLLVALTGFWTPKVPWSKMNLDFFQLVLDNPSIQRSLKNSLRLALVGATSTVVIVSLVSLRLRKSKGRMFRLIDGIIKFPAAVSHIVMAVGFLLAFAGPPFKLAGSFTILLLVYIVMYMPQASIFADAAAAQLGDELPDASAIAGAGPLRTFMKVSLPLMLPALAAGWIVCFVWMLGEVDASVILANFQNRVVGFDILDTFTGGYFPRLAALAVTLTVINTSAVLLVMGLVRRTRRGWSGKSKRRSRIARLVGRVRHGVPARATAGPAPDPATAQNEVEAAVL
jgi:iron(III) transport system permease protein